MNRNYRSFNEVAVPDEIRDADLLLYRRLPREPSLVARLIAACGRGDHYHAAKVAWASGMLRCLETRSWRDAREVSLESQVRRYPGRIDVYRSNPGDRWPEYDRAGATRVMRCISGKKYGWWNLLLAALLHLPVVRLFVRADVDDRAVDKRPPYCSHACAYADRVGGGVDPVPHLADRLTEPADLARSQFYEYQFTLIP